MFNIISYIFTIVPVLISVAMLTAIDRKVMSSMQRRIGPNTTGYSGLGQPIADGLKLAIKQILLPIQGNISLFILSAVISFWISLIVWLWIPITIPIINNEHSLIIILALTSISIYGILLSGWSANCTYSVLGSIRSAAQLVSYELSFTILIVTILLSDSYNFHNISISQTGYCNLLLYWPIAIAYTITILAETNRAPFDLPEAESELVSGYITEHSALPFAYFFLSEYGFIISQSVIFTYLFLAGPYIPFIFISNIFAPYILLFKTCIVLYIIVLIRTTLPRLRYDLLQYLAWNSILPISLIYLYLDFVFII